MAAHYLDLDEKIEDLKSVIREYESELFEAERKGNKATISRLKQLIQAKKNEIEGIKNSPNYNIYDE